jgi:glycosyltransferase involved in cell wall biosynthesis
MRQGQNPAKMGLPAYQPKKLGMALLSYIPSQNGYFSQSLEILKYQIASVHFSTEDFDLLVFDNGSSQEVQEELRNLSANGLIDFLVLSRFNLGKTGALNWILAALPNELIGFADGDVLFRPAWLVETEHIFSVFPNAGLVTAQPCLFDILKGTGKAHISLKNDPRFRCFDGHLAPEAVDEYARGTGLDVNQTETLKKNPVSFVEDCSSGFQAVIGASHMQFVLRRETARRLLPLPATYALNRDEDVNLNRSVDELGLLHLSTPTSSVYHMGNRLDEYTLAEIHRQDLDRILHQPAAGLKENVPVEINSSKRRGLQILETFSRWAFFRRMIQRLYNFLFEFYSQKK